MLYTSQHQHQLGFCMFFAKQLGPSNSLDLLSPLVQFGIMTQWSKQWMLQTILFSQPQYEALFSSSERDRSPLGYIPGIEVKCVTFTYCFLPYSNLFKYILMCLLYVIILPVLIN